MRSSALTTCAPGAALPMMTIVSAPADLRRESCGTMSTSVCSNFSTPAILILDSPVAAPRPFSFDSPHGLLIRIRPRFFAPNVFIAYLTSALSTSSSTAETRNE